MAVITAISGFDTMGQFFYCPFFFAESTRIHAYLDDGNPGQNRTKKSNVKFKAGFSLVQNYNG